MPAVAYQYLKNPTANNWAVLLALMPNSPEFSTGDTPDMIASKAINALANSLSSGSGSVAWGQITGSLSNQTDLQAALSARLVAALNLADLQSAMVARTNLGLGSAAIRSVPVTGDAATDQVVLGGDTRLTGARTPLPHAPTHNAAGSDPITISESQVTDLVTDLAAKLAIADNLSDLASVPTARTNLGATVVGDSIFTLADPSAITFLRINADNTVTALSASAFLTALGATIVGGNLVTLANPSAVTFIRLNADNSVTTRSAANFLNDILPTQTGNGGKFLGTDGANPSWQPAGVLGKATALDLNAAAPADTAITIRGGLYVLRKVMATNASTDLTALTPVVEIRDAPAGGGNLLATIPDALGFQTLVAPTDFYDATLDTYPATHTLAVATLYARLTTAAGSAATCDIYLIGDVLA